VRESHLGTFRLTKQAASINICNSDFRRH